MAVVAMVVVVAVAVAAVTVAALHVPAMEAMQEIQRQQAIVTLATGAIIKLIDTIQAGEVPTVVIHMKGPTTGHSHAEVERQGHQLLFQSSFLLVCLEAVAEIATTATMAATSL